MDGPLTMHNSVCRIIMNTQNGRPQLAHFVRYTCGQLNKPGKIRPKTKKTATRLQHIQNSLARAVVAAPRFSDQDQKTWELQQRQC